MISFLTIPFLTLLLAVPAVAQPMKKAIPDAPANEVQITTSRLAGAVLPGGIRVFKGVPFAAPPVGPRRWQAPQPVEPDQTRARYLFLEQK